MFKSHFHIVLLPRIFWLRKILQHKGIWHQYFEQLYISDFKLLTPMPIVLVFECMMCDAEWLRHPFMPSNNHYVDIPSNH